MKKQKTLKELEGIIRSLFWTIVIILILFCIFALYNAVKIDKLQTQLSECQDKVPKVSFSCSIEGHWLKVVSEDKNLHHNFNLIYYGMDELNEKLLEYELKISDCEVILDD